MEDKMKLKSCPFCGNPPETKEWTQGHHTALRIWCDSCSVETRAQGVKETIIQKWNTRAQASDAAVGDEPQRGSLYIDRNKTRHFYVGRDTKGFYVFETPDWKDQPYSGFKENFRDELTGIMSPPHKTERSSPKIDVVETRINGKEAINYLFRELQFCVDTNETPAGYSQAHAEALDCLERLAHAAQGHLSPTLDLQAVEEALVNAKEFFERMPKGIGRGAAGPIYQEIVSTLALLRKARG